MQLLGMNERHAMVVTSMLELFQRLLATLLVVPELLVDEDGPRRVMRVLADASDHAVQPVHDLSGEAVDVRAAFRVVGEEPVKDEVIASEFRLAHVEGHLVDEDSANVEGARLLGHLDGICLLIAQQGRDGEDALGELRRVANVDSHRGDLDLDGAELRDGVPHGGNLDIALHEVVDAARRVGSRAVFEVPLHEGIGVQQHGALGEQDLHGLLTHALAYVQHVESTRVGLDTRAVLAAPAHFTRCLARRATVLDGDWAADVEREGVDVLADLDRQDIQISEFVSLWSLDIVAALGRDRRGRHELVGDELVAGEHARNAVVLLELEHARLLERPIQQVNTANCLSKQPLTYLEKENGL